MNEKKTILNYIAQVFCLFGFTMIIMMSFSALFGETAKNYSKLFTAGEAGVPVAIMAQFLSLSVINVFIRYLFLTNRLIKEMSLWIRVSLTVFTVLLTIILFIVIFEWFPIYMWQPWALFIGSFLVCFMIGTFVTTVQNKIENKKLAEGLAKLKEQWGIENGTEE